tara:strand:+ start:738 stop:2237 length:1500 start_codon:yes stop_codon:yes gene_type:complete
MPQINITQNPAQPFDMAYGANPITLEGITPSEDKYALRIYIVGSVDPIADVRQSPNKFARAVFDIQNILQALVGPAKNNIDGLSVTGNPMQIADGELIQYQIGFNTETNGTLDNPWTIDPEVFTCIAGSKQYWEVPFNASLYQPKVQSSVAGCTILNPLSKSPQGLALSDNPWRVSDCSVVDGQLCSDYPSPAGIDMHNVYMDDQITKSFFNKVHRGGSNPPIFQAQGLEKFIVAEYDAFDTLISATQINNVQSNGGGPNVTTGQGLIPTGNFQVVTIGCGPANMPDFTLNAATTSYYLIPQVLSPGGSGSPCGTGGAMIDSGWIIQGFNIAHEKIWNTSTEPPTLLGIEQTQPCNDYPHIQFAWLNSLGFRDQFTFTKKNQKGVNTNRNEFLKEAADYNSTSYSVDVQSRGFTTYSQTIKETWTATTGYINDKEAELLESMFKSAQVNARFSEGEYANQWLPVRLTSNSYIQKTNRKDQLFQYTVTFTLASNIKSQRG